MDRLLLPLLIALVASSAGQHAATVAPEFSVTYAPDAKTARGPHDPLLPAGLQPCGGYPTRGTGVLRLNEAIKAPQRVHFTRGDYTKLPPSEKHVQGILFAEVIITETGNISHVQVLRSVAPGFDEIFLAELRSSVYRPAQVDGRAVPVCMVYTARPHYR
jgi:hypothetical protein